MNCDQRAIRFSCLGSSMVGIIDLPERPLPRAVLVVADQPDSRLGAQRQFAMLARALARRGFAVMRFDRRGVGDSEGCHHNDSDVRAAVEQLCEQVPAVEEVVLLAPGSAAAIATASACARIDERVRALLLLDPRRRAGRRAAHMLAPPTPAPAPIGAALFWRRAQAPRRALSSAARLAGLAEQLCAFPGPVLVLGADDQALAAPAPAPAQPQLDQLQQLRTLVARIDSAARVQIVAACAPAAVAGSAPFPGAGDAEAARAATCANWMVSW